MADPECAVSYSARHARRLEQLLTRQIADVVGVRWRRLHLSTETAKPDTLELDRRPHLHQARVQGTGASLTALRQEYMQCAPKRYDMLLNLCLAPDI